MLIVSLLAGEQCFYPPARRDTALLSGKPPPMRPRVCRGPRGGGRRCAGPGPRPTARPRPGGGLVEPCRRRPAGKPSSRRALRHAHGAAGRPGACTYASLTRRCRRPAVRLGPRARSARPIRAGSAGVRLRADPGRARHSAGPGPDRRTGPASWRAAARQCRRREPRRVGGRTLGAAGRTWAIGTPD